jgi:hypothetical protein
VDLLTRQGEDWDFATDACVRKEGTDPKTGERHLEEVAFEVVSEQNERDVTDKAFQMHRRGVRRIFALFVKGPRRVCEWIPGSRSWHQLEPASQIEDPCLVKPLEVVALLDAAAADKAVIEALAAKGNPELRTRARREPGGAAEDLALSPPREAGTLVGAGRLGSRHRRGPGGILIAAKRRGGLAARVLRPQPSRTFSMAGLCHPLSVRSAKESRRRMSWRSPLPFPTICWRRWHR